MAVVIRLTGGGNYVMPTVAESSFRNYDAGLRI